MPTRREFLTGALAFLVTACTGGGKSNGTSTPAAPQTIEDLTRGAPQLSLLGLGAGAIGGDPSEPLQPGTSLVSFDLAAGPTQLVTGGTAALYAARTETSPLPAPVPGTWSPFTGYEKTGDRSPK